MTLIAWSAAAAIEAERDKKLLIEARLQKMRVKRQKNRKDTYLVSGISERDKRKTEHVVRKDKQGLLCDCEWAKRYPYRSCKHTVVVDTYIKREAKKAQKAAEAAPPPIVFATRY